MRGRIGTCTKRMGKDIGEATGGKENKNETRGATEKKEAEIIYGILHKVP